jgi:hypothetical protein
LEGGDALVLQLLPVRDSDQFVLRREQYAESYAVKELNKVLAQGTPEDTAWLVSMLQNQRSDFGRDVGPLQIMTAIEKRDDPAATKNTALRVARPRFVWFNIATKDAPGKLASAGLRFYPLADYPAAAYSLDLPEWTKGKESVVDAWWTEDAPVDCAILRPENGKRLMDYKQQAVPVRRTNPNEPTGIVVESIAYERRNRVELKPKQFKDDVDCVVVRLRWDPDPDKTRAFFAMLPDEVWGTDADKKVVPPSMEHRFYLEAGKYTGVFFNLSPDKLKTLDKLILYSVEGAKVKAHKLTNVTVGVPNADDRPPKPQDR